MDAELITALLIFWITLVVLQCFVHHFIIEVMDDRPHYIQWFLIRAMVFIFHGAVFNLMSLSEYAPIFLFQLTSHFIIFNPLLNKLRRISNYGSGLFGFWYVGTNSGWMDRLFLGNPALYKVVYFMACILMVMASVVIYQRYV